MDYAFRYAEEHLIEKEVEYPYEGTDQECRYVQASGVVKASAFTDVEPNDPSALKAAISIKPVSVGIQADSRVFQSYSGGVITGSECGTEIDHGVLAVGYGVDEETGLEYFLVKNSWGPSWGDQGYVKLGVMEGAGVCGIQGQASYPTTD